MVNKFVMPAVVVTTLLCLATTGCASFPANANKVQVVDGRNAFTAKCEPRGPVSDSVSGWSFGDTQEAIKQVIWNMRAKAYEIYNADALSIDYVGGFTTVSGSGTALKCYKS